MMEELDKINELEKYFKNDYSGFILRLQETQAADISDFFSELETDQILEIFNDIQNIKKQAEIFTELDVKIQLELYKSTPKKTFSNIFSEMLSESRVCFFRQLSLQEQIRLAPYLNKLIRQDLITLSSYSDNTAGGIMSTDFSFVFIDMTIEEAIQKVKADAPSKKMIYYIYVVDDDMKLLGFISCRNIILAEHKKLVKDYLNENFVFSYVDEDREVVSSKIEKYSLIAIPIVNDKDQLVGIVKYDDAMSVLIDEQTEDIDKLMGITPSQNQTDYLETSTISHYFKRIGWIACLFLFGILTSLMIHKYEAVLVNIPILAMYLPMITATGGNTGSQASSVIIRALALGEIDWKDFLIVLFKELKIAIMIAVTLFILASIKVFIFTCYEKDFYFNIYILSLAIGTALFTQVIASIMIGVSLPMIIKYFNMDPSVIASPAITTLVDVIGVVIYFSITTSILSYLG